MRKILATAKSAGTVPSIRLLVSIRLIVSPGPQYPYARLAYLASKAGQPQGHLWDEGQDDEADHEYGQVRQEGPDCPLHLCLEDSACHIEPHPDRWPEATDPHGKQDDDGVVQRVHPCR